VVNEDDTGTDPVVISDGRDQREMDV
jgi:hypothetical protein